ncbi:MAG: T9SS type A sorting domain-containing protein, partial [Flavobacteriales bacterium]
TRTTSLTSVSTWTHDDGVVATVSPTGTVKAVVYDIDLGTFQETQLSSNSGNSVVNIDGVVAWVSGTGIVGAAIYDPALQQWRSEQLSSNSGNQIQNRDGVVSWVSASGIVGAAVYDPGNGQWMDDQLSSNAGNVVQNRDGVVAWVSGSGIVGAAVYDPLLGQWVDEQLSSNTGNAVVLGQGVVAWKSSSGILGAAAYDWDAGTWDDQQLSSSSSNSMPVIEDGTVGWTNSSGLQRYGYTASGQWQSNTNTTVRCMYFAEVVGLGSPRIAYLWSLSRGASSYAHAAGDGHTITRRWAWKRYASAAVYQPELTVFSSTATSTCNGSLNFVGNGTASLAPPSPTIQWSSDRLVITGSAPLGDVVVHDAAGRLIASTRTNDDHVSVPLSSPAGLYVVLCTDRPTQRIAVFR